MSDWYDEFLADIGVDPDSTSAWANTESPSNNDILWDTGYFNDATADYSNEGNNYPTTESTQGSGGSPVNASTSSSLDVATLLKKLFTKTDASGKTTLNTGVIGALGGGLGALLGANKSNAQPTGYQGGIPKYIATRQAPAEGQKISGNVTYTKAAAGGSLQSGGFVIPADVVSHFGNGSSDAGLKLLSSKLGAQPIKGRGDGMSDSIPTTIDGKDRALVAHEEAYLTPQQVARIGGGSPEKGAEKLRSMMARIREARTGTSEQGKKINPNKFMPGGQVQRFVDGGTPSATSAAAAANAGVTGTESNLSNWAGPYVTDMLAKGQALSELPFEQYTGPLTAGPSALQTQAFNTAANLQTPSAIGQAATTAGGLADAAKNLSYNPVGSDFTTASAQQYMNPYLSAALDPQLKELQRQNQIANMQAAGQLTRAGAFGGGRQAVMNAENQRNMLDKVNQLTSQGYNTAYDKAMAQFNADQARKIQEAQYGSTLGLQGLQAATQAAQTQGQLGTAQQTADLNALKAQTELGGIQQGLSAADVAAQKAAFEEARVNPFKMVQFQQSLLQGLPLAAQSYNVTQPSTLQQILAGIGGGAQLGGLTQADLNTALKNLGIIS